MTANPALAERLKTRIPSLTRLVSRARANPRNLAYDVLPALGLNHRDRFTRALSAFQPKTPGLFPSLRATALYTQLQAEGLSDRTSRLSDTVRDDMLAWFRGQLCHDPYRPHLRSFAHDAPPSDEVNLGYYTPEQVMTCPHMMALINHPDILAAMELYFGCKPTVDNVGASWAYAGRTTPRGAQRFHRDFDCTRSVKLFLYLSDVDEAAGPHVYVRGSHRQSLMESAHAQSDQAIGDTFGAEAVTRITASAGTWFLEDVYGFHKGLLPVATPRLMVGIEYNLYPSPFAPKAPFLPHDDRFDTHINRLFMT